MQFPTYVAIGKIEIHQHNGLYSLNDLHKASGGEDKHRPVEFLRLAQTQSLIAEISKGGDSHLYMQTTRGKYGGTYACRELAIAYAAWISPAFNLKVIRVFLDSLAPPPLPPPPAAPPLEALQHQLKALSAHMARSEDQQRELTALREELAQATTAHQDAMEQFKRRCALAAELSQHVAQAVAREVYLGVRGHGDAAPPVPRWLLTMHYLNDKATWPVCQQVPSDACLLTVDSFMAGLATGEIGANLSPAQLSTLAHTLLTRASARLTGAHT